MSVKNFPPLSFRPCLLATLVALALPVSPGVQAQVSITTDTGFINYVEGSSSGTPGVLDFGSAGTINIAQGLLVARDTLGTLPVPMRALSLSSTSMSLTIDMSTSNTGLFLVDRAFVKEFALGDGLILRNSNKTRISQTSFGLVRVSDDVNGNGKADGGVLTGSGTTIHIGKVTFENNSVEESGGAIAFLGDMNAENEGTFIDNRALDGSGGAIYVYQGSMVGDVSGAYRQNNARMDGGAIYVDNDWTGAIQGGSGTAAMFEANHADMGSGGAIYVQQDWSVAIQADTQAATFYDNRALSGSGGAIYVGGSWNADIQGNNGSFAVFNDNKAINGGALYVAGRFASTFTDHVDFNLNKATDNAAQPKGNGGALWVGSIDADISGATFSGNTAAEEGGAIYVEQSGTNPVNRLQALSDDATFSGNMAGNTRNAIYLANTGGNKSFEIGVGGNHTMYFDDPIASDAATGNLALNLNPDPNHTGTIRFANYTSDIYGDMNVSNGTVALVDGAALGAANNTANTFTLESGAILRIERGNNAASAINAANGIVLEGTLSYLIPANITNGETLLKANAQQVTLNNSAQVKLALDAQTFTGLQPGEYINLIEMAPGQSFNAGARWWQMQEVDVDFGAMLAIGKMDVGLENPDPTNPASEVNLIARLPIPKPTPLLPQNPSITAPPGTQTVTQGFLSGTALLSQGADLIADKGIDRALDAVNAQPGWHPFGLITGGKERHITGSHLSLTHYNLMTGVAFQKNLGENMLMLGAFYEYGWGRYGTTNFDQGSRFDGGGRTTYQGGGLLGRFDLTGTESGHFYAEGLLRIGQIKVRFQSDDIQSGGVRAHYDSSDIYYSLALGGGYVWNLTDDDVFNFYGRLFWGRQTGDDMMLRNAANLSEKLDFDDIDSIRAKIGVRYTNFHKQKGPHLYLGAAVQHEFSAEAKATDDVSGVGKAKLESADLKGTTGILECGLFFTDMFDAPVSFEFGLQGYVGQKEGVSGIFRAQYVF